MSVTTSGPTMLASFARCCWPTETTIVSRSSANSPCLGSTSDATEATASIVVRRGSIEHTIVRLAW
jgi:hypothetical protein